MHCNYRGYKKHQSNELVFIGRLTNWLIEWLSGWLVEKLVYCYLNSLVIEDITAKMEPEFQVFSIAICDAEMALIELPCLWFSVADNPWSVISYSGQIKFRDLSKFKDHTISCNKLKIGLRKPIISKKWTIDLFDRCFFDNWNIN